MKALKPETVLRRVSRLTMHLESDSGLRIAWDGGDVRCGPRALTVLEVFSRPRSLADVLGHFKSLAVGAQGWIDLTDAVLQLHDAGILLGELEPRLKRTSSGYDAPFIHIAMLNDRERTSRFLAAVRDSVRPGDIVLDIGTGTGVLAVAAARAGAGHVFAVEASGIADVASRVFEANRLGDRITLIEGWSTQIDLPDRADVLVSEMIGHHPLMERVLEVTLDARKRLLKPQATLVPRAVEVWGLPVTIPSDTWAKHMFTEEDLRNRRSWYDIDFTPVREVSLARASSLQVNPAKARGWTSLGDAVLLARIDLASFSDTSVASDAVFVTTNDGELNGLMIFFELCLSQDNALSTHPARASADNHWRNQVHVLPAPVSVRPGERFAVSFTYRGAGDESEVRVAPILPRF